MGVVVDRDPEGGRPCRALKAEREGRGLLGDATFTLKGKEKMSSRLRGEAWVPEAADAVGMGMLAERACR